MENKKTDSNERLRARLLRSAKRGGYVKHDSDTRVRAVFPWISLIPFPFYVLEQLYAWTPGNVVSAHGLDFVGFLTVPTAFLAAGIFAALGYACIKRLTGWKKTVTLVLTILHTLVVAAAVSVVVLLLVRFFRGELTV